MTWNHRVIKKYDEYMDEFYFEVHEAYYINSKGKKTKKPMTTIEPVRVSGSSLKDIEWLCDVIKKALKLPIIDESKRTKKQKIRADHDLAYSTLASAGGAVKRILEVDPKNKKYLELSELLTKAFNILEGDERLFKSPKKSRG